MKVLVAVDSITTLDILLDEMTARSWPTGTEAQVLLVVDDGDISLKPGAREVTEFRRYDARCSDVANRFLLWQSNAYDRLAFHREW